MFSAHKLQKRVSSSHSWFVLVGLTACSLSIFLLAILIDQQNSNLETITDLVKTKQVPAVLAETSGPIVVNHTSVELFDQIPEEYKQAAQRLSLFYTDRSVGLNLNEYLGCLAVSFNSAPVMCKKYTHLAPEYSVSPEEVTWEGTYPRDNWKFYICTQTECTLSQYALTPVDAFGYFTSYLESSTRGMFEKVTGDMSAFESTHPDTHVIYFTSSLHRGELPPSERFNQSIRDWAVANNKILFDAADILSHDVDGQPCYDNRDGIAYVTNGTVRENYEDDGLQIPSICQQYTTEVNGGHLGSASVGGIRLAKAFWVLAARIAGWEPNSADIPAITIYPSQTVIATPTTNYFPTPTSDIRYPTATTAVQPTTVQEISPSPVSSRVHVGDLDGSKVIFSHGWYPYATVYVHNERHQPVANSVVSALVSYSNGKIETITCTTYSGGFCRINAQPQSAANATAAVFTVLSISSPVGVFDSSANHDPDGESANGSVITVTK